MAAMSGFTTLQRSQWSSLFAARKPAASRIFLPPLLTPAFHRSSPSTSFNLGYANPEVKDCPCGGTRTTRREDYSHTQDEILDEDTIHQFLPRLEVELERDNYEEYLNTERVYRKNLSCEPSNALLLSNYAQFLYLVRNDYDRAEYYFERAIKAEPKDAEAMSRYANFLWLARRNGQAAERMYQQAIAAEPESPCYVANYASFLWNKEDDESCFLQPGDGY